MRNLVFLTMLLIGLNTSAYTIKIIGPIFEDKYTNLVKEYDSLTNKSDIILSINSDGGSLESMYKIANFVKEKGMNTHCEEICYSAATVIFLNGKKRTMEKSAKLMIHEYNFPVKSGRYTVSQLLYIVKQQESTYDKYINTLTELTKIESLELLRKIVPGKDWYINKEEAKKLKFIN